MVATPIASAGEITVRDCAEYGPGMQCNRNRQLTSFESDLIPYSMIICVDYWNCADAVSVSP